MAGLVPFTRHEAVLLLDGYLESISSGRPRLQIVKEVSSDLRQMALNCGQAIDDVNRNVNGIDPIEKQIKAALKTECARNRYGTTVAYLCSVVGNVRPGDVRQILDRSPWAEFELGRYYYVEPIVLQPTEKD